MKLLSVVRLCICIPLMAFVVMSAMLSAIAMWIVELISGRDDLFEFKFKSGLVLVLFMALSSCSKDQCPTPSITEFSGNVVYFQPAGNYTIEVQGIDGPYGGTFKVTGTSQRIEGAKVKVRIKSDCSDWSTWVYK